MNYNKCLVGGRLTRDVELRYTSQGKAVAKIGLAVNHQWKTESGEKKEEVTFIDVEAWGKQAEVIAQYVKKGQPLFVEGRLKLDSWEKDGVKHQKLKVVLEQFQFIGSKQDGAQSNTPAPAPSPSEESDDVPGLR